MIAEEIFMQRSLLMLHRPKDQNTLISLLVMTRHTLALFKCNAKYKQCVYDMRKDLYRSFLVSYCMV